MEMNSGLKFFNQVQDPLFVTCIITRSETCADALLDCAKAENIMYK